MIQTEAQEFKVQGKRFYLIYPRCSVPKDFCINHLTNKLGTLTKYLAASEKTEDGSSRLHVFIELEQIYTSSDPHFADLLYMDEVFHGKYEACQSDSQIIKYCLNDRGFLSSFKVKQSEEYKFGFSKKMAVEIVSGQKTLKELLSENPLSSQFARNLIINFGMAKKQKKQQRHLWFWGKVKTQGTWIKKSILNDSVFDISVVNPKKRINFSGYNEQEFVYINAFKGSKSTPQILIDLCNQVPQCVPNQPDRIFTNEYTVVINTSRSIKETYPKATEFEIANLRSHFQEIELIPGVEDPHELQQIKH